MNSSNIVNVSYSLNCNNYSDSNLNIIHLNAQSIRNKFSEIKSLINSFHCNIDVIVISEIFIYSNEHTLFQIPNFKAFYSSRDNKIGGGVGIYLRDSYNAKLILNEIHDTSNFLMIKITELNINILGIYRPPFNNINKLN